MKTTILLTVLFFCHTAIFAQGDTPTMKYFQGGQMNIKMAFSLNTMGGGQGNGSFGRVISPRISTGPASIFTNPSELGSLKTANIFFDTKFSISNKTFGYDFNSDFNKSISSSTNSFLNDTTTFIFNTGTFRNDTKINQFEFGQAGQFGSFALALPVLSNLTLGFGVYYPMDISSNIHLSGFRTKLESVKRVSDQEVKIELPLSLSMASDFIFRVNAISMGGGWEVVNSKFGKTTLGFAFNRYNLTNYMNMRLDIDGMIVINRTQEYHFNDPADRNLGEGESNGFYWHASGNYRDTRWGYRFSLMHQMEKFNFIVTADIVPEFLLTDPNASSSGYQPKFLKGKPLGEKEDALDIVIDSLDLSRPNKAVATSNVFGKDVRFSYPSTLNFGVDYQLGDHAIALNFVKYLSGLSYEFAQYKIGKDLSFGAKLGVDLKFPDKLKGWAWALLPIRALYFDLDGLIFQMFGGASGYKDPHYRFEGGFMMGDAIVKGVADKDAKKGLTDVFDLPLPTGIAISREYTIFEHVRVAVLVMGFPDFSFRYGIGYAL